MDYGVREYFQTCDDTGKLTLAARHIRRLAPPLKSFFIRV